MPLVGAPGEILEPNEIIHDIVKEVKNEVQSQSGLMFEEFVAVKYRSQLVNGTNYFIKVRCGPSQHLHLRVHKSFQGQVSLSTFQLNKSLEDELVYFQ